MNSIVTVVAAMRRRAMELGGVVARTCAIFSFPPLVFVLTHLVELEFSSNGSHP